MSLARSVSPRLLLLIAFTLAGCDCGGDPALGGDGGMDAGDGGNTVPDGAVDPDGNVDPDGGVLTDGGGCVPLTAAEVCPGKCGVVSIDCGMIVDCNAGNGGITCGGGETCGAGNACVPSVPADGGTCVPATCAQLGHTCGMAGDGCGGALNCWPMGETMCPTAGAACITNPGTQEQACVMGTVTCNGPLCDDVPTNCPMNSQTQITGTIVTPGIDPEGDGTFINRVPVPNAVIYIPADPDAALPDIFEGVDSSNALSCGRCDDEVFVTGMQSVLASGISDEEGAFTLSGRIPVGQNFKIVIKVGKWRRVVQINAGTTTACGSVALTAEQTRLSRSTTDGAAGTHLPHIAVSTGDVDAMECVLRSIGMAQSEFTLPTGGGRIHLYRGNGAQAVGATCLGNTTWGGNGHACSDSRNGQVNYGCYDGRAGCSWSNDEAALFQIDGRANDYDMLVFDCQGDDSDHTDAEDDRIVDFVEHGGRMFASHWEYRWIVDNDELNDSADWNNGDVNDNDDAYISLRAGQGGEQARPSANEFKSIQFRDWMIFLNALDDTTPPTFSIVDPRDLAGSNVGMFTDEWVYRTRDGTARVQQLSFNTPYGADEANICGRVAYSGFHVAAASNSGTTDFFPGVCSNGALTPQELVLVWALFDLNSCVSTGDPVTPPMCTPLTQQMVCPTENSACGFVSDGCGGLINCGGCDPGNYCSGTMCIPVQVCVPDTCTTLGYECGQHPDSCGGIALNGMGNTTGCGTCPMGEVCGSNGMCVMNCTVIPQATACGSSVCGTASNGCGGVWSCGMCPPLRSCIEGTCIYIE